MTVLLTFLKNTSNRARTGDLNIHVFGPLEESRVKQTQGTHVNWGQC